MIRKPYLALLALTGLAMIYLNQRMDFLGLLTGNDFDPSVHFVTNRTVRYVLNDLFAILLIWAIFENKRFIHLAFLVQMFGLLLLLPTYFTLKLTMEGPSEISSPLLSFLHRLIIHPFLILMLIPAFYLQLRRGLR